MVGLDRRSHIGKYHKKLTRFDLVRCLALRHVAFAFLHIVEDIMIRFVIAFHLQILITAVIYVHRQIEMGSVTDMDA